METATLNACEPGTYGLSSQDNDGHACQPRGSRPNDLAYAFHPLTERGSELAPLEALQALNHGEHMGSRPQGLTKSPVIKASHSPHPGHSAVSIINTTHQTHGSFVDGRRSLPLSRLPPALHRDHVRIQSPLVRRMRPHIQIGSSLAPFAPATAGGRRMRLLRSTPRPLYYQGPTMREVQQGCAAGA